MDIDLPLPPLHVLIVSADPLHIVGVQAAVAQVAPQAHCEVVTNGLDAVRAALRGPTHLAVLDMAIEGGTGPAVMRHLARLRPELDVVPFDERTESHAGVGRHGWPWPRAWSELDRVLGEWLGLHLVQRACASD